jgi:hypothetical protein
MTFGSVTPNGKASYPSSPTWMTYAGDDSRCMDDVPVLIRPELFCQAFLAEARVFRSAPNTSPTRLTHLPGYIEWRPCCVLEASQQGCHCLIP